MNEPKNDGSGITPLYVACQNGHNAIVAVLLATNADVNQPRDNGATPLIIACNEGHTDVVMLPNLSRVDTANQLLGPFGSKPTLRSSTQALCSETKRLSGLTTVKEP